MHTQRSPLLPLALIVLAVAIVTAAFVIAGAMTTSTAQQTTAQQRVANQNTAALQQASLDRQAALLVQQDADRTLQSALNSAAAEQAHQDAIAQQLATISSAPRP